MANWSVMSGASTLDWSATQNQVPGGATYSALMNSSLDKMYPNLGMELSGRSVATFYIYDSTATRAYGEVRSYVEAGYSPSATLQNLYAIGKSNAVTLAGEIYDGTKYQGRIAIGPGPNGWFNLNAPGAPSRSPGWHRFDIRRLADGVTYNFYVDGVLGRSFTGIANFPWDTVTIGSVAAGSSAGDAYFDGVEIASFSGVAAVPLNIRLVNDAVVLTWSNAAFRLQSSPAASGIYADIPGATSPFTNAFAEPQRFFRLIAN
ncbi:MAG: hypothetical protein KJ070_09595 [Verrucomicrobia bacterium]|nr:hypothetical protein [Verrucomicrobiota bacterium]